ncbi:EexN family lipoprotein [Leisingera sp. M658]|uniref:EexN family lipoprotein n=1 Tax=Leisingera sp. M658 TaxID=2867015 RepID=UPI0021A8C9D2|nr:EexN family lipoprotein [Leisingera sp. M658]UWQ77470.1 EexN family lipoprotein [Leisingera sp. M658]
MKVNLQISGVLAAGLLLTACQEEEPNHTVQYFLDNPQARQEMLAKCEVTDNAISDANCINADTAARSVARDERRQRQKDAVQSLYGDGS